jgi:hypothetical protein
MERERDKSFRAFAFAQTIFQDGREMRAIEPVQEGYGKGSLAVVRAWK